MGSFREKLTKENIILVILCVSVFVIWLLLVYFVFPPEWRWFLTTEIGWVIVFGICVLIFIIGYIIKWLITK